MRKVSAGFMILVIFILFGAISAYAGDGDIEVHVNGVTLPSDLKPVIRSDRVYVPIRTIAEALSYNVDYNDATRMAVIGNGNNKLEFSLNRLSATLNGNAVDMPVPALILNDRIMVPVRFITESFGCLVNWTDWSGSDTGPRGLVDIYGADPTNLSDRVSVSSLFFDMTKPVGDPENHQITCNYAVPQIHGLNSRDFESAMNQSFQDGLESIKKDVSDGGEEAIASFKSGGYAYDYSYEGGYTCGAIRGGIVTITQNGYIYSGGAHGSPIRLCFIIDSNKSKTLSLHDVLLPGQASEDAVVSVINRLAAANPDDYGLFDDANHVGADEVFKNYDGTEKTNNFYFEGNNIVIFFQPYEIGPYSSGFITFKIPAAKISDYVQPEYLKILNQ